MMNRLKEFYQKNELNDYFWIGLLLLLVFIFIAPIYIFGIPNGPDLPQHIQFAQAYFDSIKSGNFLPSFSPWDNHGFGEVGIRFYPPLTHLLLGLTQFIVGDWYLTLWLNLFLWLFVGAVGVYLFAKEFLPANYSFWAASLFTIIPYHLSQIYQVFFYSEFAAIAILPFCFLYLTRVCRKRDSLANIVGLINSCSILVLTHIPTTILGFVSLFIYAILIIDYKVFTRILWRLLIAGIASLILTSFYWVKLLSELNFVNHSDDKFAVGYKSFLFPIFLNANESYYSRLMWLNDTTFLPTFLLIIAPLVLLIWKIKSLRFSWETDRTFLGLVVTTAFAALMSTVFSFLIWDNLTVIQKIQFPMRWHSVATPCVIVLFFIFLHFTKSVGTVGAVIKRYALITFVFVVLLFDITQVILPSKGILHDDFIQKTSELETDESFECWWSIWSKRTAFDDVERVAAANRTVSIQKWNGDYREFSIAHGEATSVRVSSFYYPLWTATVNNQPVEVKPDSNGAITFQIGAPEATVELVFRESISVKTSRIISMLGWIALVLLCVFLSFQKKKKLTPDENF